ncbi:hypothetical protein L6R53_03540 [Myxococcota bacterium]|nr:hypothetical protein [Myxococcota bacterium]
MTSAPPPPSTEVDRARRRNVVQHARDLIVHLDALGRTLKVHSATNTAVRSQIEKITADLASLQETERELAFVFTEGHAFVNGVWLRATRQSWEAALLFTDRLAGLKARGLVIEPDGVQEHTLLALGRMLRVDADPDAAAAAALPGVKLLPLPSASDQARAGRQAQRDQALDLFDQGLAVVERSRLAQLDLYARRRQRALVLSLVQMAEEGAEELLALTTLRDPTLAGAAHDLATCIYSLCIGRALDLDRRDLVRLGVAALGHNLGEALLPTALFALPRALSEDERAQVRRHPLLGMAYLLRAYGFTPGSIDRAVVAAEHHLHADGKGGYPPLQVTPHLFSRVVAVADVFDAVCADRPHRPGSPPDHAVKLLLRGADAQLDPVVVRALIRVIGRYPPGSCVELDTGELAVVLGPGQGWTPLARPRVLLITDEDGFPRPQPVAVDLGERHGRRRAWLRTIARTRDPRKLGLSVPQLLFGPREEDPPRNLDRQAMPDPRRRPAADLAGAD